METVYIDKHVATMLFEHAIDGINCSLAFTESNIKYPLSVKLLKDRKEQFQKLEKGQKGKIEYNSNRFFRFFEQDLCLKVLFLAIS